MLEFICSSLFNKLVVDFLSSIWPKILTILESTEVSISDFKNANSR